MGIVVGMELDTVDETVEQSLIDIKRKAERYVSLSGSKLKIDKEMKKIKGELYSDYENIPKRYKYENIPETITVAGQTFVKKSNVLDFETVSIVMRQRIDTTLSRDGLYKVIDKQIESASTDEEKEILNNIKHEIDVMLNPHITDVVEPKKKARRKN